MKIKKGCGIIRMESIGYQLDLHTLGGGGFHTPGCGGATFQGMNFI